MEDATTQKPIRSEADLVDALNKAHDQATELATTLKAISTYLKKTDSADQGDEYHGYWAEAQDIADESLEFVQWIENRN